jgi:hypothetical protein
MCASRAKNKNKSGFLRVRLNAEDSAQESHFNNWILWQRVILKNG